ncbi:plastocyanin/azurin family copper-binding protein [Lunatimonas salinarum]|uniref:plastocyanin/azurin family copper-binding protein n=1 Tax=Lunatimonas salinarum TaxID=1774590 RepID=UPI001AE0CCBE|nr:plastocyanin/azurin family copper-binding protein [Lunatimonas salinarum]
MYLISWKGLLALMVSSISLGWTDMVSKRFGSSTPPGEEITSCAVEFATIPNRYGRIPKSIDFQPPQQDATTIWLEVVPEQMKFDLDTFAVKAGKKIILELDNRDGMQHNLLILRPNSLQKVGEAADAMLRDPKASEKHYVPEMPEVLFATEMLAPNEVYTLKFTAPSQPGYYPFVCTFPGHWRMMNGIMVVEKP